MNSQAHDNINQIRSSLDNAKSIVIAVNSRPTVDSIASSLALYLSLSSLGKQVSVVCSSAMTVEFSRLVGVDKITNNITVAQGRNLVISFPYQEGSIEKVSYNIENDTFNLVIEPREGYPQITPEMMQYTSGNVDTDLIITIDTPKLSNLDHIYQQNAQIFSTKNLLNLDSHSDNSHYGKVNYVDFTASSTSELVLSLLTRLNYKIDSDIASNLLLGLTNGSDNFTSPKTNASTFEAAAICLRHGAGKKEVKQTFGPTNLPQSAKPLPNTLKPMVSTVPNSVPNFPGIQNKPFPTQNQPQPVTQQQNDAPPDWLKPKIYKGSTLL